MPKPKYNRKPSEFSKTSSYQDFKRSLREQNKQVYNPGKPYYVKPKYENTPEYYAQKQASRGTRGKVRTNDRFKIQYYYANKDDSNYQSKTSNLIL
jgi:hypothetical protein